MKVSVVTADGKSFEFMLTTDSANTTPANAYALLSTLANSPDVRSVVILGS